MSILNMNIIILHTKYIDSKIARVKKKRKTDD